MGSLRSVESKEIINTRLRPSLVRGARCRGRCCENVLLLSTSFENVNKIRLARRALACESQQASEANNMTLVPKLLFILQSNDWEVCSFWLKCKKNFSNSSLRISNADVCALRLYANIFHSIVLDCLNVLKCECTICSICTHEYWICIRTSHAT